MPLLPTRKLFLASEERLRGCSCSTGWRSHPRCSRAAPARGMQPVSRSVQRQSDGRSLFHKGPIGKGAVCKILKNKKNWVWLLFIIIIYCRQLYTILVIKYPTLPETTPTSELPRFSTLSTNAFPSKQNTPCLCKEGHPSSFSWLHHCFIYQFLFLMTPRSLISWPELWRVRKAWGSGIMVFNPSAITC